MIPANVSRSYLEEHYGLKINRKGKTLRTVDNRPQWVNVTTMEARVKGKPIHAILEILSEQETEELWGAQVDQLINSLNVEILKREEDEEAGCG